MEKKYCKVKIENETKIYEAGTTYKKIAEELQEKYAHQIVLVYVNEFRLQELSKTVEQDLSLIHIYARVSDRTFASDGKSYGYLQNV